MPPLNQAGFKRVEKIAAVLMMQISGWGALEPLLILSKKALFSAFLTVPWLLSVL